MAVHRFYLPENPAYTILDSLHDSVRFARRCLVPYKERLSACSSFVDLRGTPMEWHEFGLLEGPGWAANAAGGAHELYWYGTVMGQPEVRREALALLDHVLEDGFIDYESGLVRGYRHIPTDARYFNFTCTDDWFCPGSMARIAHQLLRLTDLLGRDARVPRIHSAALKLAEWLRDTLEPAPNGWFPRRARPDGSPHPFRNPKEEPDPIFEISGDGVFVLDLWAWLTEAGLADYRDALEEKAGRILEAGGFFGSLNHDTFDTHESVAYAVTFRTLRGLGELLDRPEYTRFAYEKALDGLREFELRSDRNGVATRGLLWMERSWDTAYLWENAEAAQAYLEAYRDTRRQGYLRKALTILRGIAKHHYGPHGFLTEGVDWNNAVGAKHHFDGAEYGAIQYTEPLLNNLKIAEPTLFYLKKICIHDAV